MNFNIVIDINASTRIFTEFLNALKISLTEIGHNVDYIGKNNTGNDVVFYIVSKNKSLELPKDSINILFYLEQMDWKNANAVRSRYDHVFDLYKPNYERYKSDSNVLCPIGWSEAFEYTGNKIAVDTDYFLFGRKSECRMNFTKSAKNITLDDDVFGDMRDERIMRSKINIVIKACDRYYIPQLHVNLILCKRKFLMVGEHDDYYPYTLNKHFITYNKDNYYYWLTHNENREEFEQNAYEDFKKNHKFTEYLGRAFEQIGIKP
jgi:hypothetical protein